MPSWDPGQYVRFASHRQRPAIDLIARIPDIPDGVVWDLGCGSGSITALLRERWPAAPMAGLDASEEMLADARRIPGIDWRFGDIAEWRPTAPAGLVFSNAALHWVPDHRSLFPHLVAALAPGGVLAVQMPRNFEEPSHRLLADLATSEAYVEDLGHLVSPSPVAGAAWYHDLLSPRVSHLDMWETVYLHVLEGEDSVAEWTGGTAARPFLDALGDERRREFAADYAAALAVAYPRRADGTTLFPFRRLFFVAVR